jgi:hypothetical protein
LRGTPKAPSVGTVEVTTGHTPTTSLKSSLAQPEINAINSIAKMDSNFFVFILLGINFYYNRLNIYGTKVSVIQPKRITQFHFKFVLFTYFFVFS